MTNNIYVTYQKEVEKIINNNDTISIFLVGSSKNIDLDSTDIEINDIDIFVFVKQGENQVRIIKNIDGVEFDINYFSRNELKKLVDNKEYFFLKEMKDAKVIYDKNNTANKIINLCKQKYLEGPKKLSQEEKHFMKIDIGSKLSRLENKEKFDEFEYDFLTKIYLKDIIVGYFSINDKWVPKDKNLLKLLRIENIDLFNLIKESNEMCNYEDLLKIYDYVFKDISISKMIKITY